MKRAERIERRNRIICAYAVALGDDLIPLPPVTAVREPASRTPLFSPCFVA